MNTQHNPARRMVFILLVICLFFTAVSLACDDGVQDTGEKITIDLLMGTSKVETAIQDAVDNTCVPENSLTGCQHALP
jgi:hypothetical protein